MDARQFAAAASANNGARIAAFMLALQCDRTRFAAHPMKVFALHE
jgi:hypothetical protein